MAHQMTDLELRALIYQTIIDTCAVPLREELLLKADPTTLDQQLHRLHNAHMIVLDNRPHRAGEIRMALPFAAEPTNFRAESERGNWFANCAWDSLAIAAALQEDTYITSTWSDTGEPFEANIINGRLDRSDGFIQFQIPARHWWDDIVET